MSSGLFITGTDTGVGKTVVTAAVALALKERGLRVGVMKPAETGCRREDGRLVAEDAQFLRRISGCTAPLDVVNPYALSEPLAPALAAERENVRIRPERLTSCYEQLAAGHDVVLVEGAGGLLVPLTDRLTMLDLACELGLSLLLVARNALGVINHAALSVQVAHMSGAPVVCVALNRTSPGTDAAIETNVGALRRWVRAPLLVDLPYIGAPTVKTLRSMCPHLQIERLAALWSIPA